MDKPIDEIFISNKGYIFGYKAAIEDIMEYCEELLRNNEKLTKINNKRKAK